MSSTSNPVIFYRYLGAHSLLIGLLPFYLPVLLWNSGFGLGAVNLLIGISGICFFLALPLWQRCARAMPLALLLALTFALECLLVLIATHLQASFWFIVFLGVANGLYNAFFWTTQRTLFLALPRNNDTGRRYGNLQIFVAIFLKLGILLGGLLLEAGGLTWLLAISAMISLGASLWLYSTGSGHLLSTAGIRPKAALGYADGFRSRRVFIVDGLFLFLESHYWTLTLYFLAAHDYARLGGLVVALAVVFALLFFLLKNTIDRFAGEAVYRVAVLLYSGSWLARLLVEDSLAGHWQIMLLLLITFCTSFFRLAFNKRFFDLADKHGGVDYLLVKSYVSQLWLGLGFLMLAALSLSAISTDANLIRYAYLAAAIVALAYLNYGYRAIARG